MGDGNERCVGGVDGEVEIATDVGMFIGDDLEVVFGGETADVGV